MMSFDDFLESVKERVQEIVPDAEVKIQQVNKLQGESYIEGFSYQILIGLRRDKPEGPSCLAWSHEE